MAGLALQAAPGFALAGSGALWEHGLITRLTEDVDLFTANQDGAEFSAVVKQVLARLRESDFSVEVVRQAPLFARLHVVDGEQQIELDLAVDWREDLPVQMGQDWYLSLNDAVGTSNKVCALFSRGEDRDYLDVDRIRRAGVISDAELLSLAAERDRGFDRALFAGVLDAV